MAIGDQLRVLLAHGVEFIVVGGMSAALQGAFADSIVLEVVYARNNANIERLLLALAEMNAVFRGDPCRIAPNRSHLESTGHKLLTTIHGVLDVLGTIDDGAGYDDLLPDTDLLEFAGLPVRVLTLERLIRVKERLSRPKDVAMLAVLRATLAERMR